MQRLGETVSTTYVVSEVHIRQSRKLLIDLGQFFEILEYSSSSEVASSAATVFGSSLVSNLGGPRKELTQTSILPEPTRVEGQEFGSTTPRTVQTDPGNSFNQFEPTSSTPLGPLIYSDDELAVLADSFFHQRPQFGGSTNWWNVGNA